MPKFGAFLLVVSLLAEPVCSAAGPLVSPTDSSRLQASAVLPFRSEAFSLRAVSHQNRTLGEHQPKPGPLVREQGDPPSPSAQAVGATGYSRLGPSNSEAARAAGESWLYSKGTLVMATLAILSGYFQTVTALETQSRLWLLIPMQILLHELLGHGLFADWSRYKRTDQLIHALFLSSPPPKNPRFLAYLAAPVVSLGAALGLNAIGLPWELVAYPILASLIDLVPFPGSDMWRAIRHRTSKPIPPATLQAPARLAMLLVMASHMVVPGLLEETGTFMFYAAAVVSPAVVLAAGLSLGVMVLYRGGFRKNAKLVSVFTPLAVISALKSPVGLLLAILKAPDLLDYLVRIVDFGHSMLTWNVIGLGAVAILALAYRSQPARTKQRRIIERRKAALAALEMRENDRAARFEARQAAPAPFPEKRVKPARPNLRKERRVLRRWNQLDAKTAPKAPLPQTLPLMAKSAVTALVETPPIEPAPLARTELPAIETPESLVIEETLTPSSPISAPPSAPARTPAPAAANRTPVKIFVSYMKYGKLVQRESFFEGGRKNQLDSVMINGLQHFLNTQMSRQEGDRSATRDIQLRGDLRDFAEISHGDRRAFFLFERRKEGYAVIFLLARSKGPIAKNNTGNYKSLLKRFLISRYSEVDFDVLQKLATPVQELTLIPGDARADMKVNGANGTHVHAEPPAPARAGLALAWFAAFAALPMDPLWSAAAGTLTGLLFSMQWIGPRWYQKLPALIDLNRLTRTGLRGRLRAVASAA